MPRHHETRFLAYTPSQMFDLVADIEQYPAFLPWCKSAHIVSRASDEVTADLVIGYKMFQEKFTSEVKLNKPHAIAVCYRSGPLSHLSNRWTFKSVTKGGKKGCNISFEVDFDFKSPFLRMAMNVFFDKALTKMVLAFEERAAALYS